MSNRPLRERDPELYTIIVECYAAADAKLDSAITAIRATIAACATMAKDGYDLGPLRAMEEQALEQRREMHQMRVRMYNR